MSTCTFCPNFSISCQTNYLMVLILDLSIWMLSVLAGKAFRQKEWFARKLRAWTACWTCNITTKRSSIPKFQRRCRHHAMWQSSCLHSVSGRRSNESPRKSVALFSLRKRGSPLTATTTGGIRSNARGSGSPAFVSRSTNFVRLCDSTITATAWTKR